MSSMIPILALQEAMYTAKVEAEKTPIAVGQLVGQSDIKTHGGKAGVLLSYEGLEAVINNRQPTRRSVCLLLALWTSSVFTL